MSTQIHCWSAPSLGTASSGNSFFTGKAIGSSQHIGQPVPFGLTLRNWYVSLTVAPGAGKSRTLKIQKNDVDTALTITISETATSGSITGTEVTFAALDTIRLISIETNAPAATTFRSAIEIEPDTDGQFLYGYSTISDNPSFLCPLSGASNAWELSGAFHRANLIGTPGAFTKHVYRERTAPGVGHTRTMTLYLNGVKQDGIGGTVDTRATLTGTDTVVTVTFNLPVASGDTLTCEKSSTGTPAGSTWQCGTLAFEPTTPFQYMFCASHNGANNTGIRSYVRPHDAGNDAWTTTEADRLFIGHGSVDLIFETIRAELSGAPGAGKSWTFLLRKNGADTDLAVTIADSATTGTAIVDPKVTISAGDTWSIAAIAAGTPPSSSDTNRISIGYGAEASIDPLIQTRPATGVRHDRATLQGRFDPNFNEDYQVYFEWGLQGDLNQTTALQDLGAGDAWVTFNQPITGLERNTTYCFRAVATDGSSPIFYGEILCFTTLGEHVFVDGDVSHPLTYIGFIDRNGDTHPFAEVDLNDNADYEHGYKAPWVLNWLPITRGASDRTGQLEHMVFGALQSDTERFYRSLLDDPNNRYLTNRPLWEKMIDDEDRRLEGLWRYVANGFVSDYEPRSPLQFQVTGCDWLKKKFSRKAKTQRAWQPTITLEDFPTCPQSNIGLAAPLIYGSVADDLEGIGVVADGPVQIPITSGVPGGYWPYSLGLGGPEMGSEWAPPSGFSSPTPAIDADHRSFCELLAGSPSSVPTNPVATAISGGSLNHDWRSATRIIGFMVTAIYAGEESDPSPIAVADLDTYGGEKTCRAAWTAPAAGAPDGGYNIYFTDSPFFVDIKMSTKRTPYMVSSNFVRVLHVASGVTTVDFTDESNGTEHSWDAEYLYTVSAILADGSESPPSGIIIGHSSPYPRPLHLRWLPYTGAIGYRIRRSPVLGIGVAPSWDRTYEVGDEGATGPQTIDGITQYEFCDDFTASPPGTTTVAIGTSGAIQIPKGEITPIYVGEVTIGSSTRPTWLVSRGALKTVCRSAFANDQLIPESAYGATIFAPGHSGWPGADDFVDLNGRRYSLIQLDGTLASNAIDGTEPFTINVDGFEDIGDSTGTLITSLPQQQKHFMRNFLAPDTPPGTEWLPSCPTFEHEPTLDLIDESTFDAVEDIWAEANPSVGSPPESGIEGAFVIGANGELVTALDVLAQFHVSGDWHGSFTRKGQYIVFMEPVTVPVDPVAIDDIVNITADSFSIRDQVTTEFFNILPYVHTRDYVGRTDGGWGSIEAGEIDVRDATSITNYDQERESPTFELHMLRNRTALGASAIAVTMARKLARYRHPLRTAACTVPLSGTNIEVGDLFTMTHLEGIGTTGWADRLVLCTRHELDPNLNRVRLEVYDVEPLIGAVP